MKASILLTTFSLVMAFVLLGGDWDWDRSKHCFKGNGLMAYKCTKGVDGCKC